MSDLDAEFIKDSVFLVFFKWNSNVTQTKDCDRRTKFSMIVAQNFEKLVTLEV